jgi:vacuolar-type H+-ATPase subunit H
LSSPEVMKRIVEAEKESQRILDETNRDVVQIKKDSSNKIASIRQQILREAVERREKALVEAEKAGAEEAERIALQARKKVEELSRIPEGKRKQAVDRAMVLLLS